METVLFITVLSFVYIETYSYTRLREYIRERSEERTQERRAVYRKKAYMELQEKRTKTANRQDLWRAITK